MMATTAAPIAIVSPLGGAGRTTLTAHLATLVAMQGRPCLAIDLCRQSTLGDIWAHQKATKQAGPRWPHKGSGGAALP